MNRALRASSCPQLPLKSWSLINSAIVLDLADRTDDALRALDRVLRHGRENSAIWTYALALSIRAGIQHGLGALPDALADASTAVRISSAERWGEVMVLPRLALAGVLVDRGEAASAEALLTSIEPTRREEYVWTHHRYLMAHGRARRALGDAEGALALFRECGRSLEEAEVHHAAYLPWWVEAACVLAELGRAEEAQEPAAHGTRLARQWGTPRVLGLAALARGVATPVTAAWNCWARRCANWPPHRPASSTPAPNSSWERSCWRTATDPPRASTCVPRPVSPSVAAPSRWARMLAPPWWPRVAACAR